MTHHRNHHHTWPAPDERLPLLERRRSLKMAQSAHAYVRGATRDFYGWLAEMDRGAIPAGPPVWICGDLHIGNLGPLADAEGEVDIQIRDLDQCTVGNPAHDLVRLGLSLSTAARSSDLSGVTTLHMLERVVQGYVEALGGEVRDVPDSDAGLALRAVLERATRRRWNHLAKERLDHVEPTIPIGKHFWALSCEERAAIDRLVASESTRRLLCQLQGRDADADVTVLDAAYWQKGCSSLGKLRYAVLAGVDAGTKHRRYCLLDLKEAVPSVAPSAPGVDVPDDPAERVTAGARALSPNLGERMLAARLLDRPIVVRELMPQDLKLEIDRLTPEEAVEAAHFLANVVGRAHARQLSARERQAWAAAVRQDDAPSLGEPWLWSAIVHLTSRQAEAYLRHCRLHALAEAESRRTTPLRA